jgi:hypothetical protein
VDVNANIRTIESVLTGGYYRVPDFQRPYSWDTSNVEDLWDDIKESQRDYFIGSMVVFNDNASSGLIDGQQRLTTITMMLAAIRNELEVLSASEEAAGIHTLIERKDSKGKGRFVLQAEASYPYLHAAIQAKPGDAQPVAATHVEDKSLETAFGLLVERTRSIRAAAEANSSLSAAKQRKQAKAELEALRDKVYALTVVLVEVDDETDATTIFQTLNSRGKDLDTADLVKAHLLHMLKSTNAQLNQARDTWGEIRGRFDGASTPINMNRFLLHAWLSREDYVGGKDLFARIKKRVRSNNAQGYLSALDDDSQRYRAAQEPSFRAWKKPQLPVRMSLEAMSLFRLQQPLPFVLAVLRAYDAKAVKLSVLIDALQGVERFHFLSTAVTNQPSSGGISKMYALAGRSVLNGATPTEKAEAVEDLLQKLRERIPTYAEFESAFVELRSSRTYKQQTPLVRYVLNRLHESAVAGVDEPVAIDKLTVEHLIPQGKRKPKGVPDEDVARIGNLLLVSEASNEELEDKSFSEKQKILKKLKGTESDIVKAKEFGSVEILERSKRLAQRAYDEVWAF